jgi:hypothetical protein
MLLVGCCLPEWFAAVFWVLAVGVVVYMPALDCRAVRFAVECGLQDGISRIS